MRIVVSIPVHEKPDVINDLIENIKTYIEHPIIVLHISAGFYKNYNENEIHLDSDTYINPMHLQTTWGNIFQTHVSNFQFIKNLVDFDYFLMQASNDMFVKKGIEKYIEQFDAGVDCRILWQHDSKWWPCSCAYEDATLQKIMRYIGVTRILGSQVEGSFYRKAIFEYVANTIDSLITQEDCRKFNLYGREEIYYPTIASKIMDYGRCGYPTTFSEVHRFDRWIWEIRTIMEKFYKFGLKMFISQNLLNRMEGKVNQWLFDTRWYKLTKRDINAIICDDQKYLMKNESLNDYPGYWEINDGHYYSVKRVPRNYDDPIRVYIRNLKIE